MPNLLAVVALDRSSLSFKGGCVSRFAVYIEVLVAHQPLCICLLGDVDGHGPIGLWPVFAAKPCYLSNLHTVLFAKCFLDFKADVAFRVQDGSTVHVVHFYWEKLISDVTDGVAEGCAARPETMWGGRESTSGGILIRN